MLPGTRLGSLKAPSLLSSRARGKHLSSSACQTGYQRLRRHLHSSLTHSQQTINQSHHLDFTITSRFSYLADLHCTPRSLPFLDALAHHLLICSPHSLSQHNRFVSTSLVGTPTNSFGDSCRGTATHSGAPPQSAQDRVIPNQRTDVGKSGPTNGKRGMQDDDGLIWLEIEGC